MLDEKALAVWKCLSLDGILCARRKCTRRVSSVCRHTCDQICRPFPGCEYLPTQILLLMVEPWHQDLAQANFPEEPLPDTRLSAGLRFTRTVLSQSTRVWQALDDSSPSTEDTSPGPRPTFWLRAGRRSDTSALVFQSPPNYPVLCLAEQPLLSFSFAPRMHLEVTCRAAFKQWSLRSHSCTKRWQAVKLKGCCLQLRYQSEPWWQRHEDDASDEESPFCTLLIPFLINI